MKRVFPQITLVIFSLLFFMPLLLAQQPERCFFDQKMAEAMAKDPDYAKLFDQDGNPIGLKNLPEQSMPGIITIPVHVIIIHPPGQPIGTGDNLTMARIESQIAVLNEDFRRLNSDSVNTPAEFPTTDSEIEFCLAAFDPNGNPTDGVTRYPTTLNIADDEFQIKQATTWDRNNYLNMWVGSGTGLLGWAYLPSPNGLPNAILDGIVVETGAFGGPGYATLAPYDLGRTATHEIGHYLGLRHMWGNGGCSSDDNLSDTPRSSSPYFGCPAHPQTSCNTHDMFMNYMDYVNDDCMNAFTPDQGDYMNLILNTSRSSLLNAANTNCLLLQGLSLTLIQTQDLLCNGDFSGVIEVEAAGGLPPYTYEIDGTNPQSSGLFTGVSAGLHIISVTDDLGNQEFLQVSLDEPDPLLLFTGDLVEPLCFDSNDGSVLLSASGGTPPYLFSLNGSTPQASPDFPALGSGFYLASVIDANNCETFIDVFISAPTPIVPVSTSSTDATCYGYADGELEVIVTGGTPDYLFSIDGTNYSESGYFQGIAAGNYDVFVEDDNGCNTVVEGIAIGEPDSLTLEMIELQSIQCFGEATATISLVAQGGTVPYLYAQDGMQPQSENEFSNLSSGGYSFVVEDANGCTADGNTFIFQPDTIIIDTLGLQKPSCQGDSTGSIFLSVTGGVAPYVYFFDGDTIGVEMAYFTNLPEGVYPIEVHDANGCVEQLSINLFGEGDIIFGIDSLTAVTCYGGNNGSIALLPPSDSIHTYQYSINGNDFQQSPLFEQLPSGNYTVVVQDENGCTADTSVFVSQPDSLFAGIVASTMPLCQGDENGSIQLEGFGGDSTFYSFSLNGQSSVSGLFEGLAAGNYLFSITDGVGCLATFLTSLDEPEPLEVLSSNIQDAGCDGESNGVIELTVAGGTVPLAFHLDGLTNNTGVFEELAPENYVVEIVDANNCSILWEGEVPGGTDFKVEDDILQKISCNSTKDGIIQLTAQGPSSTYYYAWGTTENTDGIFDGLGAGTYAFTVTDDLGCTRENFVTLDEPEPLVIKVPLLSNPSCAGSENGIILLDYSGGTGSASFTLNDSLLNETGDFEGLAAGTWHAVVTDDNGCETDTTIILTEPEPISLALFDYVNVSCFGGADGELLVAATGGSAPYFYTLGNLESETGEFNALEAGTYILEVTDTNDCIFEEVVVIESPAPVELAFSSGTPANCGTGEGGSLQLIAEGGTPVYTFLVGNETNNTGIFNGLESGNYEVTVSDGYGCSDTGNFVVEDIGSLNPEVGTLYPVSCDGAENGAVQLIVNGGNGSFEWELNGEVNNNGYFGHLAPGVFEVMVADTQGCSGFLAFEIANGQELEVLTIALSEPSCHDENDGSIQFGVNGGSGVVTYFFNGQSNMNGFFTGQAAGIYEVIVEDSVGCAAVQIVEIEQPPLLLFNLPMLVPVSCYGLADGAIQAGAYGGTGVLTYELNNETNETGIFEGLPEGSYTISVVDENGCESELAFEIIQPDSLQLILETQPVNCHDGMDGVLFAQAIGGNGDYVYTIDNSSSNDGIFEGLEAGIYTVMVEDANGCGASLSQEVTQPEPIQLFAVTTQPDDGSANGIIEVQATGGTPPFEFSINNGDFSSETSFNGLEAGFYTITTIDGNGCIADTVVEVSLETAVISIIDQDGFLKLFPNPFDVDFSVLSILNRPVKISLTIHALQGVQVYKTDILLGDGRLINPVSFPTSLPNGAYLVNIRGEGINHQVIMIKTGS